MQVEPQFNYDLERMELALKGPFYTMPSDLSFEEFLTWLKDIKNGKVLPNTKLSGEDNEV